MFLSAKIGSDGEIKAVTFDRVKSVAAGDDECVHLCNTIRKGFPGNKGKLPQKLAVLVHER